MVRLVATPPAPCMTLHERTRCIPKVDSGNEIERDNLGKFGEIQARKRSETARNFRFLRGGGGFGGREENHPKRCFFFFVGNGTTISANYIVDKFCCHCAGTQTGRIRFRGVRFQTPSSVSFLGFTEFWGASSVSSSQPVICVPKRTHRVFFSQKSPSLPRNSVRLSEFSSPKQYSRNSVPPVSYKPVTAVIVL